jgi:hypothetical protein
MPSFLDLFLDLPLEIHHLILEKCSPNDEVCLRLASKRLYDLISTITPASNATENVEPKIPLTQPDFRHLCGETKRMSDWREKQLHRYQCHFLSKAEDQRRKALQEGRDPSGIVAEVQRNFGRPGIRACKVRGYKDHCECFNRPLWKRLEGWIRDAKGQDFRYCSECNMFTKRKRWHNGRCYHGRGKPRRQKHVFWTYKKGGGGYRWKEKKLGRRTSGEPW